jgi:tetratricopeptide (TPR) repeat protein
MKLPARIRQFHPGWACAIFAGVLLLRLDSLAWLTTSASLLPPGGDMHFYNDWARRILQGHATEHLAFYGLPGYAYLLALVYRVFGYNPFAPGLAQCLLDAGTAVLIYWLTLITLHARRAQSVRDGDTGTSEKIAAALAAAGWAFFVPAQAYSIILMPTAWFVFAFWLIIWRIVRPGAAWTAVEAGLIGLLIGITATAVANILLLVPLALAAVMFKRVSDDCIAWKRCMRGAATLIIGAVVGTAPCWIHNYFVARDPVLLSAHSGVNFWIGNNPNANGYPSFPPGLRAGQAAMLQDSITQAESAAGRPLKRAAVSAYWSEKANDYIRSQPEAWLRLLLLKLRNFWSAFQYDDLSVITNLREQRVLFPGIYFGLAAALSIPGLFFVARFSPQSRWMIAAIGLALAGVLSVFVTERYRLVAVPGLLVFAVYGLSVLWNSLTTMRFRTAAVYLLLLVGATFFVSLPQTRASLWALDAYNSGWQALQNNNLPLAEKKLALAYAYAPTNPETNFALGNVRLAEHQTAEAKLFYNATLKLDPHHKGALNNFGIIELENGNLDRARQYLEQALVEAPNDAKTHYLLAKTLYAKGDLAGAREAIDKALLLKPKQREFVELRAQLNKIHSP